MVPKAVAKPLPSSILSLVSTLLITSIIICNFFPVLVQSQNTTITSSYDLCSPFTCGNITFSFPFSYLPFGSGPINCGLPGYQITCSDDPSSPPSLFFFGRLFQLKSLHDDPSDRFITVVDTQLIRDLNSTSCASVRNLTTSNSPSSIPSLSLPPWTSNLTLFNCPAELALDRELFGEIVRNYSCEGEGRKVYLWQSGSQFGPPVTPQTPNGCDLVMVPVLSVASRFLNWSDGRNLELVHVLADGFPLTWPSFQECYNCRNTGGRCGFDAGSRRIVCFCDNCNRHKKSKKQELIIGIATGSCGVLLLLAVLLLIKKKSQLFTSKDHDTNEKGINAEQFVKNYQSTLLTNYSTSDIKKMTNGFKERLGEGGFGTVYKGKLLDGRLVGVKLLQKSNNAGHDFVNEVASIGRIHHVNVINLLGFSWSGSKRALIYEYMPNGSLADLLSNKELILSLGMVRLLEIAMGVAHGIEYLHNGCESRILHLDIKPQNVLLDQNFSPKISDFGLAKMYSRSRSDITMTGARGTIGYIAPEIFMRNLGNASHKSDVYSYGMLLLEMAGGKKHVEPSTSSSSEAYFPGWIYDKLMEERDVEKLSDSVVEEDAYIARKMVMVGLWCILINPKYRPSMTRVVEMLSGSFDAIEMPPKPFFSSPPAAMQEEIEVTLSESDDSALRLTSKSQEDT